MRRQVPLTRPRVGVHAELLSALTEALLKENFRSQEYERTAASLAQMNQAKDQFLAMLAHELRNPLAAIRMATHFIGGEASKPDEQRARQVITRQIGNLTRMLDDLLDISRISSGKIKLRKEPVNLGIVISRALEASCVLVRDREHSLSVSLPEDPVWVEADSIRLEQVIANLVNNAAQYTYPKGHIEVSTRREGSEAVIRVQ